tara:strand:- start:44 stop:2170 length:2127 start_codon:yes stop_codon:yes gene_type:complete
MSSVIARFFPATALLVAVLLCTGLRAQEPLTQSVVERMIQPRDPAVEQTILRAQRSPADLGQSISALTRMGQFEGVEQLLSSIEGRKFNEQQKIEVAEQITGAERLRIVDNENISPQSVVALDGLFDLHRKNLISPARLAQAVDLLTQQDADQTLPAIRTLFSGGEASTAALVHAIVTTTDASKRDKWLRAMIQIDEQSGVEALRRVALYGTEATRTGALTALIRLSPGANIATSPSMTEILTALYRRSGTANDPSADNAASLAASVFKNSGRRPSRAAVIELLRVQLAQYTRLANLSARGFGRAEVWVMNPELDGVKAQRMPDWMLRFRDAADAAARLVAIGDDDVRSVTAQLSAMIAYTVVADPDWGSTDQVAAFRRDSLSPALATMDGMSEAEFILDALSIASESDNDPAMLGWLRLISPQADISSMSWLVSSGTDVSPLVMAVDNASPQIRYEAAAAIARLAPSQPYAGSNRVLDRWEQMSLLTSRATAIVLENRPEVVAELELLINQAGLAAQFVSSVAGLQAVAAEGEDMRLILSKRQPTDASAIEMIDVVRRIRVARDVPIVIYSDPPPQVVTLAEPEEDLSGLNEAELQAHADAEAIKRDRFGVLGGLDNVKGVVHRDLLYGDLDVDHTAGEPLDLSWAGERRWGDESLRAGLISELVRPRSIAGLYDVLRDSRSRQHLPPLSPIDRSRYRQIAEQALAL